MAPMANREWACDSHLYIAHRYGIFGGRYFSPSCRTFLPSSFPPYFQHQNIAVLSVCQTLDEITNGDIDD